MSEPTGGRGWYKSSRSANQGNNQCVEIRHRTDGTDLRDSKNNGSGAVIAFTTEQFDTFLDEVLTGRESANGAAVVTHADRLITFCGKDLRTMWHVRSTVSDHELHFTEAEWEKFRSGVEQGEFNPRIRVGVTALATS